MVIGSNGELLYEKLVNFTIEEISIEVSELPLIILKNKKYVNFYLLNIWSDGKLLFGDKLSTNRLLNQYRALGLVNSNTL